MAPTPGSGGPGAAGGAGPAPGPVPGLDLRRRSRIHLVGVGGAGMSGIATILATMGHTVTGSDRRDSPALRRLAAQGIAVGVGHDAARVRSAEIVGASSAVPPSDPELVEAARLGLDVRWRVELLAAICGLRRTVAVAGTKGKSTTTAMVARILDEAGERPSLLVGGDLPGVDGGARWVPDSDWFVVEADESDGTFLALPAEAVVVTNVEADHLDQYGSMAKLREAFVDFASRAGAVAVIGVDSAGSREVASELRTAGVGRGTDPTGSSVGPVGSAERGVGGGPVGGSGGEGPACATTGVPAAFRVARELVDRPPPRTGAGLPPAGLAKPSLPAARPGGPVLVTYGTAEDAEVRVVTATSERASAHFTLLPGPPGTELSGPFEGVPEGAGEPLSVALPVPGLHNVRNACAALTVAASVGVALEVGVRALASYSPVARRFEPRGEHDGVEFVDDYAHVPSAVVTTIATARAGGWSRIVAVFQPHLYSRTEALGAGLGEALAAADLVVVADVYGAREQPRPGVDGTIVAAAARRARPDLDVRYVADRGLLAATVRDLLRPGDLCITIGAGDITTLPDEICAPGRLGAQQ